MRGLSEVPVIGAGWSFIVEVMENGEALAFGAAGSFLGGGLPGKVMISGVGGGVYHAYKGGGLNDSLKAGAKATFVSLMLPNIVGGGLSAAVGKAAAPLAL